MPVIVARHAEREDYRMKFAGLNWQETAERPWDTPLTPAGHKQGIALGEGIAEHVKRLSLPPVTKIFTSPLLRCAQTAAAAASQLGVETMCVEPSLAETICEDWYRSWGIPGADSTWGTYFYFILDKLLEDTAGQRACTGRRPGRAPLGSVVA